MPATGALIGTPASISDRVEPHTDAIEVEPFDDSTSETTRHRVGPLLLVGHDRRERPLGERAVADLAALGRADPAGLTGREGREVVVVHVALLGLERERVEDLLHARHAERGDVSTWVSPRWNRPEPCAVLTRPTSADSGRMSARHGRRCGRPR